MAGLGAKGIPSAPPVRREPLPRTPFAQSERGLPDIANLDRRVAVAPLG
jgi:hypothetical protein